jgi:hypothetical protein
MKSSRRRDPATYHSPRDTIELDRRSRRKHKELGVVYHGFFVPSFGVKRPVRVSEELIEFTENLKSVLPKNYKVRNPRSLSMTLSEQGFIVNKFRSIGICPEPEIVSKIANTMQGDLKQSLKGVPRWLDLPIGEVDSFGKKGSPTRVGLVPNGWRGFGRHYGERNLGVKGSKSEVLPLPVIVRESNIIAGAIINGFSMYEDFEGTSGRLNPTNRNPHITIAEKQRGGSISQSEMMAIEGIVKEVMPEEMTVELFDPVTFVRLDRRRTDTESGALQHFELFARGPRALSNLAILNFDPELPFEV